MAFREYKIGSRMFGLALGTSMFITLYMPAVDMAAVSATSTALDRQLAFGTSSGFSYSDPFLEGVNKPVVVTVSTDPSSGSAIEPTRAFVYPAGVPFPSGVRHPRILGAGPEELSETKGRMTEADRAQGAVFVVREEEHNGQLVPYIENATATRGWDPEKTLSLVDVSEQHYVGKGKIMFVREGCWWCHTLLPEQTQDWQYFGAPPLLGDFNGESPTAFGSDRKAPDLTHVASRNSSREWMMMHFFNPRLVQPHSIMPRYDYLWGDVDASGNAIDYKAWYIAYDEYVRGDRVYPPDVPVPHANSEARALMDFVLNLK